MHRLLQFLKLRPKKILLAQTQEAFDTQASEFLLTQGFPNTSEYQKMFGAFIQHSKETEDSFDPELLARCIRKAKASEFAFYLIYPEKRKNDQTGKSTSAQVV